MDHFETFECTLSNCIKDMFGVEEAAAAYGLEEAPEPVESEVIFASIGFACEGAQGSLLLLAPRETARGLPAIPALALEGGSEVAECDVIGELSNMLIGRLKNKLLHRGVVLMLGTPMTTIARMARVLASTEPTSTAWFCIELPSGPIFVRLDARFEPTFELQTGPESVRAAGVEGDMLFF